MTNDKIQITSAFVASLLAIAVLTSSMQIANAQENQTEVQESTQIEESIDQLLQVHPVLSELMQEDDTGVIEYLNGLETQEAGPNAPGVRVASGFGKTSNITHDC